MQKPLFSLPFAAPAERDSTTSQWWRVGPSSTSSAAAGTPRVLRLEGRRAVGKERQPCRQGVNRKACGTLSSEDRDGDGYFEARAVTTPIRGSAAASARCCSIRALAPLTHAWAVRRTLVLGRVARPAHSRARGVPPDGYGHARPGAQSAGTLGLAFLPWEDRGSYQRLVSTRAWRPRKSVAAPTTARSSTARLQHRPTLAAARGPCRSAG